MMTQAISAVSHDPHQRVRALVIAQTTERIHRQVWRRVRAPIRDLIVENVWGEVRVQIRTSLYLGWRDDV